jgi:predicted amidohydrolase
MIITTTQLPVSDYVSINKKTIIEAMEKHSDSDWLVTPEGSLSGYCQPPSMQERTPEQIQELREALNEIEELQRKLELGLVLGTGFVEQDGLVYNQQRVYDPQSGFITAYSKRLLTRGPDGGGEIKYYAHGWQPRFFNLDANNHWLASTLICNDAWATPQVSPGGNPYYWTEIAQAKTDVVFVSVNCNVKYFDPLVYEWHDTNLRIMARTHGLLVVVSNSSTAMGWGPEDRVEPSKDLAHKQIDRVQCPSGIISPEGEWIAKCEISGTDSATLELSS